MDDVPLDEVKLSKARNPEGDNNDKGLGGGVGDCNKVPA